MFWLILILISIFILFLVDDLEPIFLVSFLTLFISIIIFLVCLFSGINTYPTLKGLRTSSLTMQKRVESIKKARYKYIKTGKVVSGSLDNMSQSKALSEFIGKVAESEAIFNKRLEETKIYKNEKSFWWFAESFFISDKVLELEKL